MSGLARLLCNSSVYSWQMRRDGSSQHSHIIQKYPGHIHRGVSTDLMFLKFHNSKWTLSLSLNVRGEGKWSIIPCISQHVAKSDCKFSNPKVPKWVLSIFKMAFPAFFGLQAVCPLPVAAGMNGWLFVGPYNNSPGTHQFAESPGTSGHG